MAEYKKDINYIVTLEDVKGMIAHADNLRDKALICVSHLTGARPSEIRLLKKSDVWLIKNEVHIRLATKKLGKVRGFVIKERELIISKSTETVDVLLKWCEFSTSEDLFESGHGFPMTCARIRQIFDRASDKKICPYHFRHSRLTKLARAGKSIDLLMYWKGAAGLQSVGRYLAAKPVKVAQKLD